MRTAVAAAHPPYRTASSGFARRRRGRARELEPEAVADAARVHEAVDAVDHPAANRRVGEPQRVALALLDAGDHERLGVDELLDPVRGMAEADARVLPAAHGDAHREVGG